jgi:hypothetical protein
MFCIDLSSCTQGTICFEWIKSIPAALSGIIITGYIAWRQLKTNEEKLKLELYNKRYNVYEKTKILYNELMIYSSYKEYETFSTTTIYKDFLIAKTESQLLFPEKSGIHKVLENIHKETKIIIAFKENSKYLNDPALVIKGVDETNTAFFNTLPKSIDELLKKMKPYLSFK